MGKSMAPRHEIARIIMGNTPGNSATIGERIVENLANKLHIPKAVPVSYTGNT